MGVPLISPTDTMTNVDLTDITIKTEPLSPESVQQVLSSIGSPTSYHTDNAQPNNHQQTILSPTPTYLNTCPDSKQYLNLHPSPLMSSGVVKANPEYGDISTPTNQSTRSALRGSILSKRKARGETTPLTCNEDGPREYRLTKREVERKEARKEQNRRAARRCRMKKKRIQLQASKEMQMAIKENVDMKEQVEDLRRQVIELQQIISDHEQTQQCKLLSCHSPHHVPSTHPHKVEDTSPCHTLSPMPSPHPSSSACLTIPMEVTPQDFLSIFNPNIPSDPSPTLSEIHNCTSESIGSFQTPVANNSDWNNTGSGLQSDEVSQDIKEIIQQLLDDDMLDLTPPKIEEELDHAQTNGNKYPSFSCPQTEEIPKKIICRASNSKPPVVRDLNKVFVQNETHQNSYAKSQLLKINNSPLSLSLSLPERTSFPNDTVSQANRFLLDSNLSSPVLSCVPPNLVQPIIPTSSKHTTTSSTINDCNHPFLPSPFNSQYVPTPTAGNDVNVLPMADIESLTRSSLPPSSSTSFLPYPAGHGLPPGATLTDCCINNNTSTTTGNDTIHHDHFSGLQLSPISTPSPSSTCTVSSPGFLQQISPHSSCHISDNNNNNNSNNNNRNNNNANNDNFVFDFNFH